MTASEEREALVALDAAQTRVTALRLRVLAHADQDQIGADDGSTSMPAWLAQQARQTRSVCGADLRLGTELAPAQRLAMAHQYDGCATLA